MMSKLETTMGAVGAKMGVATAFETSCCFACFAGLLVALAFVVAGFNLFPCW